MSLTRFAAKNLVPLLSRVVLAAAFVPVGYDKIMGEETVFHGSDAITLNRLGVGEAVSPEALAQQQNLGFFLQDAAPPPAPVETGRLADRVRPTRQPDDSDFAGPPSPAPPPPVVEPEPEPEPPSVPKPTLRPPPPVFQPPPPPKPEPKPEPKPRVVNTPAVTGDATPIKARRLHYVTVMLVDKAPWTEQFRPVWLAWAAAGTELVGGGLILVGLLSRFCGLGLAITMGFAFYLTSLPSVLEYGVMSIPVEHLDVFNRIFTQAGLFVMAASIMLTGAGGISIDGLFFRSGFDEDDEHLLHLG